MVVHGRPVEHRMAYCWPIDHHNIIGAPGFTYAVMMFHMLREASGPESENPTPYLTQVLMAQPGNVLDIGLTSWPQSHFLRYKNIVMHIVHAVYSLFHYIFVAMLSRFS